MMNAPQAAICPNCNQPILPQYYFCPNCGKNLHEPPLPTSLGTQLWIYAFSIILPMIGFLAITKWQGMKYIRSEDPATKQIGQIAWFLIIVSTVVTFWYAYVWTTNEIQASINSVNSDMSF